MRLHSRVFASAVFAFWLEVAARLDEVLISPAYELLDRVLFSPVLSVLAWLVPEFAPDARQSTALDALAREAKAADIDLFSKAKAFLSRALRHKRWSAGGFMLDTRLSPA